MNTDVIAPSSTLNTEIITHKSLVSPSVVYRFNQKMQWNQLNIWLLDVRMSNDPNKKNHPQLKEKLLSNTHLAVSFILFKFTIVNLIAL